MHDSFLCVSGFDRILDAVRQVWASAYNERALVYRRSHGISLDGIAVAVIVQQMIDAQRSGVMFTCNPTTGNPHQIVINSLLGVGEGLVSAGLAADTFTVDKGTLEIRSELVEKAEKLVADEVGNRGLNRVSVVEHERTRTSLTDEQLRAVAKLAWLSSGSSDSHKTLSFVLTWTASSSFAVPPRDASQRVRTGSRQSPRLG